MPRIEIKIEELVLDNDNPRITHADGQQQALQKVVKDQKMKLVRLAESIVEHGLSPIDKMMVMEVSAKPRRFIALEGNRRVTALRLLANPAAMTGLDMPNGMQRAIERLSTIFERNKVEPIEAFEVPSREDGRYWIELRHNGEDEGRGVVAWKPVVAARFREKGPDIQALDMVLEHGGFSEEQAQEIRSGFPLTTLRRLLDSREVLKELGLSVKGKKLLTKLPGDEIIKPLRKMVKDIAEKNVDSRSLNKGERLLEYVQGFKRADRPDLSKAVGEERPVEGIKKTEFQRSAAKGASSSRRKITPVNRHQVVPRSCRLNVTDNRIGEIYQELQSLRLEGARNAIAVLLRVFLEMSIDHFLEANGGSLTFQRPGGPEKFKTLDKKLAETVDMLVSMGVSKSDFSSLTRDLTVKSSPMNMDLFHSYVHDRFATPSPPELTAAWDHAQPLFEKIWR